MSLLASKPEVEDDKISLLSTDIDGTSAKADGVIKPASNGDCKEPSKLISSQPYLDVPLQDSFRPSIDTVSGVSNFSVENDYVASTSRSDRSNSNQHMPSRLFVPPKTWKGKWAVFWKKNKGLALVLMSQFFGALMNVTTRLLETDGSHGHAMHPFQILFARMGITVVFSSIYMWWTKVPHFPFGMKEVRRLLIVRGVGGFFGVYGMYYSLLYLPLAEAIVITFLAPIVACWACSILIHEPFTRMEQIAGIISLVGVLLIARPTSIFSGHSSPPPIGNGASDMPPLTNTTAAVELETQDVTPAQRLGAVGVAMIGVIGAAIAYTTIRWIGKRAHPLISVNYFAVWCTFVSFLAFFVIPGVEFRLPSSLREWTYLFFLGICGFIMQFLLTAGLQHEKSSRATNMVYTQMLFALAFDKIVWGSTPGLWSLLGSSLILGSAVYVAVQNDTSKQKGAGREGRGDEEVALVGGGGGEDGDEEDGDGGRGPLRGVQEVQLRTIRV